jgi:hypothetical protein
MRFSEEICGRIRMGVITVDTCNLYFWALPNYGN